MLCLSALFFAVLTVCAGQTVTVHLQTEIAHVGERAQLNCSYSITGDGYSVFNVQWSFGEEADTASLIAAFLFGSTTPTYDGDYAEPDYMATRNGYNSELVIAESSNTDNGIYWCRVDYVKGSVEPTGSDSAKQIVIAPEPVSSHNLQPVTVNGEEVTGETLTVTIDVELSIVVRFVDISPAAEFKWMLGTKELPAASTNTVQPDGLITSTSTATWTPSREGSGKTLTCTASNGGSDFEAFLVTVEDNTTTTTPQDTTTPTFTTSQETTMSPSGPTETTSDFSSTEPSTTINTVTGSINKTTTQMGSTEMTTDPTEMTTDPTEMTTDPTEMTNSTHITPSTTATTPETTTTGCTIPCHAGRPDDSTGRRGPLSDGVIIGIVAGCLGGVAIIAVSSVAVWNYHKKTDVSPQTDQSKNGKNKKANGKAAGVADV
ncbi:uncharacterized protein [Asterias amurensis]|uniref:uncharacterized protein isoform X1 n=1 Tax=Asterias amurensis TaxID=7602 RepID=UPI003AB702F3